MTATIDDYSPRIGRKAGCPYGPPMVAAGRRCLRPYRPSRVSGRACTSRPLGDDELAAALAWNMVVPPAIRGALFSRELDGSDVLARTSVPVLVSHGRDDMIVLPSMAERTLTACPAATASWYDGVGHMPFWEAPDRFDFLHVPRPCDRTHPGPPARRHCPTAASTRPAETAWSSRR